MEEKRLGEMKKERITVQHNEPSQKCPYKGFTVVETANQTPPSQKTNKILIDFAREKGKNV